MKGPKTRVLLLLLTFLVALVLLSACLPRASAGAPAAQSPLAQPAGQIQLSSQPTGISVQGQGSAFAAPDLAEVTLGVSVKATSVAEAQGDASARMARVMDQLGAMGITKDQIKTVRFNIFPQYGQNQQLTGYMVENMVSARTKSMDKVGQILDAVTAAGANRVERISFTIADPKPLAARARDEAMADAKGKAGQLAKLAGVTLGQATFITENVFGTPPPPLAFARASEAAPATPISPGEMEIQVGVQVTYAIE